MRDQDSSVFLFGQTAIRSNYFVEKVFADVRIDCGKWIVEQVERRIFVNGSSETVKLISIVKHTSASFECVYIYHT